MTRQRQSAHHTISSSLRWLTITLGALCAWQAAAQGGPQGSHANWPTRSVRLIVSQAAGGAPDIVARLVSERLSRNWNQQVIVDNRPGSGNVIGAQVAARAPADGYTLFFATAAALVTNPYTFKSPGFDADRDFAAVISIGVSPFMIGVNPELKINTVAQLVALAKAQPGKLSFATSASRNLSHITGEMLKSVTGIDMLHVPYKGSPQAAQDTIAGQTQLFIDSIPTMSAFIKSGRLKVVGVSSARRMPGFEDVPAIAETIPGFEAVGWFAIVAPANTPADIIARMNKEMNSILAIPDDAQRMRQFGMFEYGGSAAELDRFMRSERSKWARVMREAKIEPE